MSGQPAKTDRSGSLVQLATALESMLSDIRGWDADALRRLGSGLHPDAADALANVAHFVADADIRARDVVYRDFQEKQMRELIAALRRGARRDELLSITFLR